MRESSYNLSKQNSQQPKDIRGGEKKVMKKSLSTILSLAMAFSMFSSVALAADADKTKTSADFSDLKDLDAATKAKFDALISAGVFDGVKEGTFGLKDEMNRAQFAKVAALIFGLKVDTSLKTSSFSDVKADDPANGYALAYIEAVKAAGITDGYAPGQFNPAGKVTKEQLAAFLIRGINKDADAKATPGVNDATVSDWAKGYVALALNLKLLSNGADGKFGGTSNATRDLLVLGAYEGKNQFKGAPFNGKYAINSFKATDANVLTLTLNGALTEDAAKNLKIEIKKDGNVLTSGYTTKWDDKKTVATLTFESKFQDNSFDATISGVSNIDDTAKTSNVKTTPEKISKIDFLTASDTIPLARDKNDKLLQKVRIDFKATNQYGVKSSLNASNFDIRVSGGSSFNTIAGEQAIELTQEVGTERNDRISVSILHTDSGSQVSKIFAVGDESMVSKVEVGDLMNSTGTKVDSIEAQGVAYLDIKAYDQYGFRIQDKEILNKDVTVNPSDRDLKVGDDDKNAFVDNVIGDNAADLKLQSTNNEEKEITVTVFARGGQSVTKTIKVLAQKLPASIEFGAYNYTLAENDKPTGDEDMDQKFYVPLILKDSKGQVLDATDIVNAFQGAGDSRGKSKLRIDSYGGIDVARNAEIEVTGAHKGQIKISGVGRKGSAYIRVSLEDKPTVSAQLNISVGDPRTVEQIKFSTTPKKYMLANTDNEFKLKFYDQNGSEIKFNTDTDADKYYVRLDYSGTLANSVKPVANSFEAGKKVEGNLVYVATKEKAAAGVNDAYDNRKVVLSTVAGATYADFDLNKNNDEYTYAYQNVYDKSFKFYSPSTAVPGSYTLKATLFKNQKNGKNNPIEVSSVTTTLDLINPATQPENRLTYEVYLDKGVNNNTILATDDFLSDGAGLGVTGATYVYDYFKKATKEIKVRAKRAGGEEVAIKTEVVNATSSDPNVVAIPSSAGNFVAGLNEGKARVSVTFKDGKKEQSTGYVDVTTKNAGPEVASIALRRTYKTVSATDLLAGLYLTDNRLAEKITVKDQYGDEFVNEYSLPAGQKNEERTDPDQFLFNYGKTVTVGGSVKAVNNGNTLLNLSLYITDADSSKFDNEALKKGQIKLLDATYSGSFTVNVLAPNGKSAAFTVTVPKVTTP
ncbi:S-layer homology domain-containing protein [Paenibacillus radicis (ex Xue et al. 2023)]|uniref:S-layer homology domain-containing protein n=1 Tax=Paenibacillus radicis (ex Xue et al. 2023) TaxID=2972489 RepID=A0ABT1YHA2_9BACL|nr:S-layer homology domain-containing protein [Paenibacillus radicis (ex Xue et al. 2023)]MCR8632352.1 S-layer homology domain-containing protein [Paenibacillus radicis (ex Xue et al. 2023)]